MIFQAKRFQGNARLSGAGDNSPAMRYGETGQAVRLVQQALHDLNYPMPVSIDESGAPDGIFGYETRGTVWQFQFDQKLADVDGVVGNQTLTRLDELLKGRPYTPLAPLEDPTYGGSDTEFMRQLIIQTLQRVPDMHVTIMRTEMIPTEGENRKDPKVYTLSISNLSFRNVIEAVRRNEIKVKIDPAMTEAAHYVAGNEAADANTFVFDQVLDLGHASRAKIIHEATHAAHDLRGRSSQDLVVAETCAVIAEAYYFQKVVGKPKEARTKEATRAYHTADQAVTFMRKGKDHADGKLVIDGVELKYANVMSSLFQQVAAVYGRGEYQFDGV
jgi:peptidoglycan hydrolase-like protein with peptidoglycan-binding domain